MPSQTALPQEKDKNTKPTVAIGLPVYNGENYLREAIDSLLAQDYVNFKIVISDNASTDSTGDICREYVARDDRITYHLAEKNLGACWNFNRVLELSEGDYFMWAAHDDLWAPGFISKCVEALERDKEAVLCHSQVQDITADGKPVGKPYIAYVNEEATTRGRWHRTHTNWQLHTAIYGIMRMSVAKKVRPPLTFISCDLIFVAEISIHGKIIQIPEVLQYNRLHAVEEERDRSRTEMLEYLGTGAARKIRMLRLNVMMHSIRGLKYARLPFFQTIILSADSIFIYLRRQLSVDVKELLVSVLKKGQTS
jgi:glycosyltransferase involved in cell wall biosynthesis